MSNSTGSEWRRILVPVAIELPLLHVMLLWGTGWDGGHLHEFVIHEDRPPPRLPTPLIIAA